MLTLQAHAELWQSNKNIMLLIAYNGKKYLSFYSIQFLDCTGIRDKLSTCMHLYSFKSRCFINSPHRDGLMFLAKWACMETVRPAILKASYTLLESMPLPITYNLELAGPITQGYLFRYCIPWRWDTKERYPVWDYMPLVTCHDNS